jgi:hypothetical protein
MDFKGEKENKKCGPEEQLARYHTERGTSARLQRTAAFRMVRWGSGI